jgi:hypothetical protein
MCTLLGRPMPNGEVVMASTSDDPYDVLNHVVCAGGERPYLAVRVLCPPGAEKVPFDGMLTRGLNLAGLGFTYAFVGDPDATEEPQTWGDEFLRECTTVAEALSWLGTRRGRLLPGNYLSGDAEGDAAAVEVTARDVRARAHDPGSALVCANRWEEHPTPGTSFETMSEERYQRGRHLLGAAPHPIEHAADWIRDHGNGEDDANRDYGGSICNHGRTGGTISGELFDLRGRRLWYAFGWPCGERQGHEESDRTPWRRFTAFAVDRIDPDTTGLQEVTTPEGGVTTLGMALAVAVEPAAEPGTAPGGYAAGPGAVSDHVA